MVASARFLLENFARSEEQNQSGAEAEDSGGGVDLGSINCWKHIRSLYLPRYAFTPVH